MERVAVAEGRAPSDLLLSMVHAVAFGELLDLALRLHLLENAEGMGVVRRDLKMTFANSDVCTPGCCSTSPLSRSKRGHDVAMEKRMAVDLAPTDLVITTPIGQLDCETFAVLTDDVMRQGTTTRNRSPVRYAGSAGAGSSSTGSSSGAHQRSDDRLAGPGRRGRTLVKSDGEAREVDHPIGPVRIFSLTEAAQRSTSFTGPPMTGGSNDRLGGILRKKAQQAAAEARRGSAPRSWTGFGNSRHGQAGIARQGRGHRRRGATGPRRNRWRPRRRPVCGPAMAQGSSSARARASPTAASRYDDLSAGPCTRDGDHPAPPTALRQGDTWVGLYDGEPDWLDWALDAAGLPTASSVLSGPAES